MPDAPLKKPKAISDWLNRPRQERLDVTEERRKLSEALTEYVQQNGGWVTSPPGAKNLRIETPQKSSLPTRLLEIGYSVRSAGISTRLESGRFTPIEIIEISLPGK